MPTTTTLREPGGDYAPRPDIPPSRPRHDATRAAALAAPDLWHRLEIPACPRRNADWRAADIRRGMGGWSPERSGASWQARVAPVEGGFAVYVRPVAQQPAAVTS